MNGTITPGPTPEHLAPFERSARIYCRNVGLDADEELQMPNHLILGTFIKFPRWYEIAERLRDLSLLLGAMKQAKSEEQTPQVLQS